MGMNMEVVKHSEYESNVHVPTGERSIGGIRCKISLRKGGHSVWGSKQMVSFFDVDPPK